MRTLKVLHTGDIHFRKDLHSLEGCLDTILEKAKEVDLAIIAGDLFDERVYHDSMVFQRANDFVYSLASITPTLLLKGTPSHDGNSIFVFKRLRGTLYIAEKIEQIAFTGDNFISFESDDIPSEAIAVISCLPTPNKAVIDSDSIHEGNCTIQDLLREVLLGWGQVNEKAKSVGKKTILVGHIGVSGASLSTGQQLIGRDIELGVEDMRLAKAELVCLGHIHKAQNWGEIFYCGSIDRLNFGEKEEKGFWIHTLDKKLKNEFIKTPARELVEFEFDGKPSIEDIEVSHGTYVKLKYRVYEEEANTISDTELEKALLERGAESVKIEKIVIPCERVRSEKIAEISTMEEKLKEWANVNGTELPAGVVGKLNKLEEILERGD